MHTEVLLVRELLVSQPLNGATRWGNVKDTIMKGWMDGCDFLLTNDSVAIKAQEMCVREEAMHTESGKLNRKLELQLNE